MSEISYQAIFTGTSTGPDPVTSFRGEHAFLSNFLYPCPVMLDGEPYPSAEHAFQAAKTLFPPERRDIAMLPTPQAAKRHGRAVTLRPDWEQVKRAVMLQVVLDKFLRNPDLIPRLTATGQRALIEGNWWGDTDWGAVADGHPKWSRDLPWWHDDSRAPEIPRVWAGFNWLGIALMMTREVLAGIR